MFNQELVSFDKNFAIDHSIDEAIVMQFFLKYLNLNKLQSRNIHRGHYWMFGKKKEFLKELEFYRLKTFCSIINKLVSKGLLLEMQFNGRGRDKDYFYTTANHQLLESDQEYVRSHHEFILQIPFHESIQKPPITFEQKPTKKDFKEEKQLDLFQDIDETKVLAVQHNSTLSESHKFLRMQPKRYHESIIKVMLYWGEIMGYRPNLKMNSAINKKRAEFIYKRLKEGYTLKDCYLAIDGCARSKFHMGMNDQNTKYNDIHNIFNERNFEKFQRSVMNEDYKKEMEQDYFDHEYLESLGFRTEKIVN